MRAAMLGRRSCFGALMQPGFQLLHKGGVRGRGLGELDERDAEFDLLWRELVGCRQWCSRLSGLEQHFKFVRLLFLVRLLEGHRSLLTANRACMSWTARWTNILMAASLFPITTPTSAR